MGRICAGSIFSLNFHSFRARLDRKNQAKLVLSSKTKVSPKYRKSGSGFDFSSILGLLRDAFGRKLEPWSDFCGKKRALKLHRKSGSIFMDFGGGSQDRETQPFNPEALARGKKLTNFQVL